MTSHNLPISTLLVAFLAVSSSLLSHVVKQSDSTTEPPFVKSADSLEVILAEVLFDPKPGEAAFVELLNTGSGSVDLNAMVLRIDSFDLPLPRLHNPVVPGSRVVIWFDGGSRIEGNIVHTSANYQLNPEGGVVSLLRNDDHGLDRLAWGNADAATAPTIGGRVPSHFDRGGSFGRPPGANQPGASHEWVSYAPGSVTPGTSNPLPPVAQLLPLSGAVLERTSTTLGWYSVPGAVRYSVQLAGDSSFSRLLLDTTVTTQAATTGQLQAGVYWWRVQTIGANSPPAPWSESSLIELGSRTARRQSSGADLGDGADAYAPVILNVPYLSQHKDSKMLLLESQQQGAPRTARRLPEVPHAWAVDHGVLNARDPADNANCGLASIAMMNRFYGGDLSQDRIGYEVFSQNVSGYVARLGGRAYGVPIAVPLRELETGPERDLNYGYGLFNAQTTAAAFFALGELPSAKSGWASKDETWDAVRSEIDAGRPLVGFTEGHLFVIRGYAALGNQRLIFVNDPWILYAGGGFYGVDLDAARSRLTGIAGFLAFPNHPAIARQEPSVTIDTDRDGVVDFDEVNRFRTNPGNADSDADGVNDREDIESGVFESEFNLGYAFNPAPGSPGRDYDVDRISTELDPDSDAGGCKDGEEDTNGNGIRDGTETSNFIPSDDRCGPLLGNISFAISAVNSDPNAINKEMHDQAVIAVKLKPESDGSATYVNDGSSFIYSGWARVEINIGQSCILWGRETSRGGGPFVDNAEIGGNRADDGTLTVGARASVPSQTSAGGCTSGSGSNQGERGFDLPECLGTLVSRRAADPPGETYRFNCTTKPDLGPGWTVTRFYMTGYVRAR